MIRVEKAARDKDVLADLSNEYDAMSRQLQERKRLCAKRVRSSLTPSAS